MKRSIADSVNRINGTREDFEIEIDGNQMQKKIRKDPESVSVNETAVLLDENLLYEILKHVDARTLGALGCVNKHWNRTAQDERLWELICTKHWPNIGWCGNNQLRSVVLALGGFRRLHSQYLRPLFKSPSSSSSSSSTSAVAASWPCLPPPRTIVAAKPTTTAAAKTRWGKDEVHLSLSLLSIRYYEKMNNNNRK